MKGTWKKDEINNHIEDIRYKGLRLLKKWGGPFTTVDEVKEIDANGDESPDENIGLYTELRYAKNSCVSLKHTASERTRT